MQARELLLLSRQDGELSGLGEGKHAKSETLSLITAPPSTTLFWGDIRVAIANLGN